MLSPTSLAFWKWQMWVISVNMCDVLTDDDLTNRSLSVFVCRKSSFQTKTTCSFPSCLSLTCSRGWLRWDPREKCLHVFSVALYNTDHTELRSNERNTHRSLFAPQLCCIRLQAGSVPTVSTNKGTEPHLREHKCALPLSQAPHSLGLIWPTDLNLLKEPHSWLTLGLKTTGTIWNHSSFLSA